MSDRPPNSNGRRQEPDADNDSLSRKLRERRRANREELRALMASLQPPGFDAAENADQVRQRGELYRLCHDIAKLPEPSDFLRRHQGWLRNDHRDMAYAAYLWLEAFLHGYDGDTGPPEDPDQGTLERIEAQRLESYYASIGGPELDY